MPDACTASRLQKASLTPVVIDNEKLSCLDIDVSVLEDTCPHKEGIAMSYHKVKGYAPVFCYAGQEGCMVADELRPGSQHSGNGACGFVERCVGIMQSCRIT